MNQKELLVVRGIARTFRSLFGDLVMLTSEVAESEPVLGALYRELDCVIIGVEATFNPGPPVRPTKPSVFSKPVRRTPQERLAVPLPPEVDLELLHRNTLRFHALRLGHKEPVDHLTVLELRALVKKLAPAGQ